MQKVVTIIGGGLAGIMSALELKSLGLEPILIDNSLPQAEGELGGFTKFSGAKFSLPPAGLGLLSVASELEVEYAIHKAFRYLDLEFKGPLKRSEDIQLLHDSVRSYESLLLMPTEINSLVVFLHDQLVRKNIKLMKGKCTDIKKHNNDFYLSVHGKDKEVFLKSDYVFYAGGRLGTDILLQTGLEPTSIKGLDLGVRVEFASINGLKDLRKYGPDAKVLYEKCRTFCLNSPGSIYRYPFMDFTIPGGVVEECSKRGANVGILCRVSNKALKLDEVMERIERYTLSEIEEAYQSKGTMLGEAESIVKDIYGVEVTKQILEFGDYLHREGFISWDERHSVHIPLIDWHWNTYSQKDKLETNIDGLFCLGDASGHARGLLQAAVSGILAAREIVNA